MHIKGYTENKELQDNGAPYEIMDVGVVYLRRCGLACWNKAVDEARDEVLGTNVNTNYIDYEVQESITSKAVANYLVAKIEDFKDVNGSLIPSTKTNICAIFENPSNYSLCLELIEVASSQELFLLQQLAKDTHEIKKS